ncbi:MAG: hypothetical protein OXH65_05075 [Paracoccaceae bacterium]|nr:hypothetical protein [Paracoccaceae bacterium]
MARHLRRVGAIDEGEIYDRKKPDGSIALSCVMYGRNEYTSKNH